MKPIGINSKDFGCCPGHDKVPYRDQPETKRGRRDRKINRKRKLTRYWKRSFKSNMKTTILLLLTCLVGGCNHPQQSGYASTGNVVFPIVIIDSCEYLQQDTYGHYIYIHKGNCKNPIHFTNHVKQ